MVAAACSVDRADRNGTRCPRQAKWRNRGVGYAVMSLPGLSCFSSDSHRPPFRQLPDANGWEMRSEKFVGAAALLARVFQHASVADALSVDGSMLGGSHGARRHQ